MCCETLKSNILTMVKSDMSFAEKDMMTFFESQDLLDLCCICVILYASFDDEKTSRAFYFLILLLEPDINMEELREKNINLLLKHKVIYFTDPNNKLH